MRLWIYPLTATGKGEGFKTDKVLYSFMIIPTQ